MGCPGNGGVTAPGAVPERWRCGTEGCVSGHGGVGWKRFQSQYIYSTYVSLVKGDELLLTSPL